MLMLVYILCRFVFIPGAASRFKVLSRSCMRLFTHSDPVARRRGSWSLCFHVFVQCVFFVHLFVVCVCMSVCVCVYVCHFSLPVGVEG